jgi:hypothetical protein
MGLPLQQTLANLVLQRFDLSAQRGLCQKNPFRGTADVAVLGHRHKVPQLSEFHAGAS